MCKNPGRKLFPRQAYHATSRFEPPSQVLCSESAGIRQRYSAIPDEETFVSMGRETRTRVPAPSVLSISIRPS